MGIPLEGTNPSRLVEAMGAGNAIIAKDNEYNRWVAGAGAPCILQIMKSAEDCIEALIAWIERALQRESEAKRRP